jgi:DNA mismatch repair protein MutS2
LRGKRADAALGELGTFLDKALLANMEGAEIVHGRGTGALRREVHNFLRNFPGIAGFSLAPEEQGGDGMTMVTFK